MKAICSENKSILFVFIAVLLLTVSVYAKTAIQITIEWTERGLGGHTHFDYVICDNNCDAAVNKRVTEIKQSGGVIIEIKQEDK